MDLGKRLKIIRHQNNLKQQQIADVLGITRSTYCSYEIGRRSVDLDTILKLARFYKLPVEVFIQDGIDTENVAEDNYENDAETKFLSQLSRDEIALIVKYRMMTKEDKKEIKNLADSKIEK